MTTYGGLVRETDSGQRRIKIQHLSFGFVWMAMYVPLLQFVWQHAPAYGTTEAQWAVRDRYDNFEFVFILMYCFAIPVGNGIVMVVRQQRLLKRPL